MASEKREYDISVIVLTYCHEKYISQALDSILTQKTHLKYEILVGDDGSHDKTPEIITAYANKYAAIIVPVLRKENIGATKNNLDLHLRAKGKYVAVLEGDDFWLDKYKLQKQYDFLETHSEYSACCGKCMIVDEDGTPDFERSCHFALNRKAFTMRDFIESWDLPGQAGTRMCRNFYKRLDEDERDLILNINPKVGDKSMALLILMRGPIYCSNDVLSAYRFVDKKGKNNWFSIHHANPYRNYDMFMYPCRLESWARKNLPVKLPRNKHFGKRNPYRFARFVEECVKKPERRKFQYLLEMIAHSHQPLKYSWYVLKALIEME